MAKNNKVVAKNAILLYFRMLFSMLVSLYTTREILSVLGVESYGVYMAVGGVVGFFTFLNSSMSGATSRFITYNLGKNNTTQIKEIFSAALIIHILTALIIILTCETIGYYFLTHELLIAEEQLLSAKIVFHISVFSLLITFTQVPYTAVILAHEKMNVYAYVEILNVCLKLLIVYLLTVIEYDKLITYAILLFVINIIIAFIYRLYAIHFYDECKFTRKINKESFKQLLSFSGFDLFGNICGTAKAQGSVVVLNMFFGPIANASASIAGTVIGSLSALSNNVMQAYRPRIVKSYACADISDMCQYIRQSSTYTTLLLMLMAVPILAEINYVLELWLKDVPDYAAGMAKIAIISSIAGNINAAVLTGIHATGNIRTASILGGSLYLINIMLMYLYLKMGGTCVYTAFATIAAFMIFVLICDICILHKLLRNINFQNIYLGHLAKLFATCVISYIVTIFLRDSLAPGLFRFVVICIANAICLIILAFIMLFNHQERSDMFQILKRKVKI